MSVPKTLFDPLALGHHSSWLVCPSFFGFDNSGNEDDGTDAKDRIHVDDDTKGIVSELVEMDLCSPVFIVIFIFRYVFVNNTEKQGSFSFKKHFLT